MSVCNYIFCMCECTCERESPSIMQICMQMKSEGACAPEPVCMFVLVCELTRPTTRGFATTHTDRCEDRGESERARERDLTVERGLPRCANIALLSLQFVSAALSFSVCLSPSWSHFIPTVPNTEGLFVVQRRKCNWSQICHPLFLISPAFVLMVSRHAACPKNQSDTWEQRR